MSTTITGPDGKARCSWCAAAPEFLAYHDTEWGSPGRARTADLEINSNGVSIV